MRIILCQSSSVISFLVFEKRKMRKRAKNAKNEVFEYENERYFNEKVDVVGVQHF
jgi:hypothetical protein